MAQSAAPNRVYQDFVPFFEWAEDEGSATLTVMLPGNLFSAPIHWDSSYFKILFPYL